MANEFLYILMRTDLGSMNPGKAVAQGSHATAQFIKDMNAMSKNVASDSDSDTLLAYKNWSESTNQGFGTTITLAVNGRQLLDTVALAQGMGQTAGVTHDPTYPLRDGDFVHLIPLDTCGYVFGTKDELKCLLGSFDLMA